MAQRQPKKMVLRRPLSETEASITVWGGNCTAPDSAYVTDGRLMLRKDALTAARVKLLQRDVPGNSLRQVTEDQLQSTWDTAVEEAVLIGTMDDCVIVSDNVHTSDKLHVTPSDTSKPCQYFNPAYIQLALTWTKADSIWLSPQTHCAAVMKRGNDPVAILMPRPEAHVPWSPALASVLCPALNT